MVGPDGRVIVATTGYKPEEFDALVETIRKTLDQHNKRIIYGYQKHYERSL